MGGEDKGGGCLCNFLVRQLLKMYHVYHLPIIPTCYANIWRMSTYLSMCISSYVIYMYFILRCLLSECIRHGSRVTNGSDVYNQFMFCCITAVLSFKYF